MRPINETLSNDEALTNPLTNLTTRPSRHLRTMYTMDAPTNYVRNYPDLIMEEYHRARGHLPSTIFLQVDGGSENAGENLLVACGLVRLPLPVGHTHEDLDYEFNRLMNNRRLARSEDEEKN